MVDVTRLKQSSCMFAAMLAPDLTVRVEHHPTFTRYGFRGELPLLWTERLAEGLAALGEDIAELRAERASGVWDVMVDVRGAGRVDVLHLLRDTPSRGRPSAPHLLESFDVVRASDQSLELSVRAEDRAVFLAFLLRELRTLALFPSHVSARSRGALADDRLGLVSVGGAAPSEDTARALRSLLHTHTRVAPAVLRAIS